MNTPTKLTAGPSNDDYREVAMRILGWLLVATGAIALLYFAFGPRDDFYRHGTERAEDVTANTVYWIYWLALSSFFVFSGAALVIYAG